MIVRAELSFLLYDKYIQNQIKVAQAVAYSRSNDAKAALHLDYVCVVMIDQMRYLWHLVWL